jgi:hypothetical protein
MDGQSHPLFRIGLQGFSLAVAGLLLLAVSAAASSPLSGGPYAGTTSQGRSVTIVVSSSGRSIDGAAFSAVTGTCTDGTTIDGTFDLPFTRVSAAGGFSQRYSSTDGNQAVLLTGRFADAGHSVSGTLRAEGHDPADGSTCSATISFEARRRSG